MKIKFDDCLTIGDFNEACVCIIWLHGYGADNWGFEPLMKILHLELDEKVFIVIPNAPIENQKRSWYPLPQKNEVGELQEDYEGLTKAIISIRELFQKLSNDSLESSNNRALLVGGFSQGAALGLAVLCDPDTSIDGCISLSGYMPCAQFFLNKMATENEKIFIGHGTQDNVISIETHNKTMQFLKKLNVSIEESVGQFGHTVPNKIIFDVVGWIRKNYLTK